MLLSQATNCNQVDVKSELDNTSSTQSKMSSQETECGQIHVKCEPDDTINQPIVLGQVTICHRVEVKSELDGTSSTQSQMSGQETECGQTHK